MHDADNHDYRIAGNINQLNQLDIQHDNDHHYGGTMHRRLHMAMERGRPDMAKIRLWQLLDRVLMPSAGITGNG